MTATSGTKELVSSRLKKGCGVRITYPLVHLQPSNCVFDIVLKPKKPCLPQSQSPAYQIEQIFSLPFDLQRKNVLKELVKSYQN